jgi:phosphatidylglycerol---prolipoprotein diacylglyceryl transferase
MRYRLLRWAELDSNGLLGQILVPDQPVLSTLGGILAVILAALWARRDGLVWWKALLTGGACALVGAVLGRVGWLLVDVEWARIAENPYLIIDPYRGGAISFGALIGAVIGAFGALKLLRADIWKYADVLAAPGLVGIAFARVGCIMRACCYGTPSDVPWAIRYPIESNVFRRHYELGLVDRASELSLAVHPFPLYLAAWGVACFAAAWFAPRMFGTAPGTRALGIGIVWLTGRLVFEFLRHPGNAPMVAGPINTGQLFAMISIACMTVLFIWRRRVASD